MTQSITQTLFFKNECVNNMMDIVKIARADTNAKGHGGTVRINNGKVDGDCQDRRNQIHDRV